MAMDENNKNVILGYDFDADIQEIESWLEGFENNRDTMSNEEYINGKNELIGLLNNTIERNETKKHIYSVIKNEDDLKIYETYDRWKRGDFTDKDNLENLNFNNGRSFFEANKDFHTLAKWSTANTSNIMNSYNNFYTDEGGTIHNNRTIKLGEKLYNRILNIAEENDIDLSNFIHDGVGYKFTIPRDKKSFIEFADLYSSAIQDSFLNGMFLNTANEAGRPIEDSDNKWLHQAGVLLNNVGGDYKDLKKKKEELDNKYKIFNHYRPIISPGNKDIIFTMDYLSGDKQTELKIVDENIKEAIQGANLLKYTVYGNEKDIKSDNGGSNPLSIINDSNVKKLIMDNIYSEYGGGTLATDDKHGKLLYDFSTSGYNYGTWVRIPKGTGFYEIYIENLLPSKEAELYVQSPKFKASAYIENANGIAIKDRVYRNNLGNHFSGSFKAYGDDIYTYTLDGIDLDKNGKKVPKKEVNLTKDEAVALKMYSDVFNSFCINNGYSTESPYNEEDIIKFIYNSDEADPISFMNILTKISGLPENQIQDSLLNMYRTYYKK